MTDHYVQTVEVAIDSKSRKFQIIGISLKLLSFGFIPLSIFVSLFCLFGVFVLFAVGIAVTQLFNNSAKEFEYDFDDARFVVSKTNAIGRRRRYLELLFCDVENYGLLTDMISDADLIVCGDAQAQNVRYLTINLNAEIKRLIFAPDEYMTILIEQRVLEENRKNRTPLVS